MRNTKGYTRAIAVVGMRVMLAVAIFAGFETMVPRPVNGMEQPASVSVVDHSVTAAQEWVGCQADKLDTAICRVLYQLECACTGGFRIQSRNM